MRPGQGMGGRQTGWWSRGAMRCVPLVVIGLVLLFWFIEGLKGAVVGILYGVVAALFLMHEHLAAEKGSGNYLGQDEPGRK